MDVLLFQHHFLLDSSTLNCLCSSIKDQLTVFVWAYFWAILFHWSMCLFFHQYHTLLITVRSVQFSHSVLSDLCDPMDCSRSGLPVNHQLLELTQTHVHWVGDVIQPSHPLSSPSPPALNLSQHQGLFKWVSSLHKAEMYVFVELSCVFHDPADVGNLISGSSAFSKTSLNIWEFMVNILLKPGLENFEHYFASMWDDCNCAVVWAFFGIAFLRDWNESWPFPVLLITVKESESEVAQSCRTLCNPMGYSLRGSSLHGILQARVLEYWLPFPSPGDLPDPGIEPGSPAFQGDALTSETPAKLWLL